MIHQGAPRPNSRGAPFVTCQEVQGGNGRHPNRKKLTHGKINESYTRGHPGPGCSRPAKPAVMYIHPWTSRPESGESLVGDTPANHVTAPRRGNRDRWCRPTDRHDVLKWTAPALQRLRGVTARDHAAMGEEELLQDAEFDHGTRSRHSPCQVRQQFHQYRERRRCGGRSA